MDGLDGLQRPFDFSDSQMTQLNQMVRAGDLSVVKGGLLDEFEGFASKLFGSKFAVSTCNGSAAIFLGLHSLGVGRGDEVILPTYGFHGAAATISALGATPVFVDNASDSLTIDVKHAGERVSTRTKAIMVLQPWGNLADVDELVGLRERTGVKLLSDSSHAHDALWRGKPLGSYYDVVAASFGKGKLVSGGELGVLTSDSAQIHDSALMYAHTNRVSTGLIREAPQGIRNAIGLKLRPSALALQIGIWNSQRLASYGREMRRNGDQLMRALQDSNYVAPVREFRGARRSFWKPAIRIVNPQISAADLVTSLVQRGVAVERNNYETLLHEDPIFSRYYKVSSDDVAFPNAMSTKGRLIQVAEEQLLERGSWLSIANAITEAVEELKKN